MKKIFLMFVLMGIMIVSAGILVSAKDEIGIVVNGENANMKVSPKIIDGGYHGSILEKLWRYCKLKFLGTQIQKA